MGQSSEDLLSPHAGNNFTLNLNYIDRDELTDIYDLFLIVKQIQLFTILYNTWFCHLFEI